jgi:hypothetical protein
VVLCGTRSETSVALSKLTHFLANCKTQNAFLFPVHAMFPNGCHLAVKSASASWRLVHKKKTWRYSLPIDMLLFAASVLVVAQSNSEFPEGISDT